MAEATDVASDRNSWMLEVFCIVRWLLPRRRIEQASEVRKGSKRRSNDRTWTALEKCAHRNVLRRSRRWRCPILATGIESAHRRRGFDPSRRAALLSAAQSRRDDEISEASLRAA